MIIFDLDGTLADCSHRRYLVEPPKDNDLWEEYIAPNININERIKHVKYINKTSGNLWKPDWKAFYEACDKDKPILQVIKIWNEQISLGKMGKHQIWSGRCESVRQKTQKWLDEHLLCFEPHQLKMRLIGDSTPDDKLKERWLDEYIDSMWPKLLPSSIEEKVYYRKDPIEFVFDDRPKACRMWRRRGIFVFDCNQNPGMEF